MVKSTKISLFLLYVGACCFLSGCAGLAAQQRTASRSLADEVVDFALTLEGKPYRAAAAGPRSFDCSGLVYYAFGQHGITLPRDSRSQARIGIEVQKRNLQKGDLLFFKGRNLLENRIGHVGLVTKVTDEGIYFIHATSRGVVVDELEEMSYYRKRYVTARRLPELPASARSR